MRASNFVPPAMPTLRQKLRKVPRRSFSMATAFACSSLRWVSTLNKTNTLQTRAAAHDQNFIGFNSLDPSPAIGVPDYCEHCQAAGLIRGVRRDRFFRSLIAE
jgi:hypothetical protein